MKFDTSHIAIGLGLLSLLSQQFNQPKPQDQSALYQLSAEAIRSARGTSICISWDCGGQQEPVLPASTQTQYLYEVAPGQSYVDTQGQEVPRTSINGKEYLVGYRP